MSRLPRFLLALALVAVPFVADAATITIVNQDDPGEGFNDPTPTTTVGGNTGDTLGEQRRIAFAKAAEIWGATLASGVDVTIEAQFDPLFCTSRSSATSLAPSSPTPGTTRPWPTPWPAPT